MNLEQSLNIAEDPPMIIKNEVIEICAKGGGGQFS